MCVPCCEVLVEMLCCLVRALASEITLAMTGEDSTTPADPGGEETVGIKQSSQQELLVMEPIIFYCK